MATVVRRYPTSKAGAAVSTKWFPQCLVPPIQEACEFCCQFSRRLLLAWERSEAGCPRKPCRSLKLRRSAWQRLAAFASVRARSLDVSPLWGQRSRPCNKAAERSLPGSGGPRVDRLHEAVENVRPIGVYCCECLSGRFGDRQGHRGEAIQRGRDKRGVTRVEDAQGVCVVLLALHLRGLLPGPAVWRAALRRTGRASRSSHGSTRSGVTGALTTRVRA